MQEGCYKRGEYLIEVIAGETGLSTIDVIKLKKQMDEDTAPNKVIKKQAPGEYGDNDGEK